jgi:hypothetical protein
MSALKVVNGAAQAPDSALATASVEVKWMNGWSAAATFTDQNYADIAAFLLEANGYSKGDKELPTDTPSQQAMSLKRGQ